MKLGWLTLYFLFFLIFFIFKNHFVISQIIPSNDNIKLDININNKYSSYGSGSSDYSTCSFKNKFNVTNLKTPSSFYGSPLSLTRIGTQFTLEVKDLQADSQNTSYQFRISDPTNANYYTDFTLYLLCEKLDTSTLVIKPVNDTPVQSGFNSFYFYLSIKPLRYSLDILSLESPSSNGIIIQSTTATNKEYYYINFMISDIQKLIDSELDFDIVFPQNRISIKLKPLYNSLSTQQISTTISPSSITTFTQNGNGFSPVLIINSTSSASPSYTVYEFKGLTSTIGGILKLISQNQSLSTYVLSLSNLNQKEAYQYSILYNDGSTITRTPPISVTTYNGFQQNQPPLGQLTNPNSIFVSLIFSGNQKSNAPYQINYYTFNNILPFPFGFISGTNSAYNYKVGLSAKVKSSDSSKNKLKIQEYPSGISRDYDNPVTAVSNSNPPYISLFELRHVVGFKYLVKLQIGFTLQIHKYEYIKNSKSISFGAPSFIEKLNSAYLYESLMDIKSLFSSFKVTDILLNELRLSKGSIVYNDTNGSPVYFDIPVKDIDLDIQDVKFLKNDIDILDKASYNRIYFNSSTIPHDYPLEFSLVDPISLYDFIDGRYESLPIVWSEQIKLFYCDFTVPMNTGPKIIEYKISTPYRDITSDLLVPLRVSSTNFDNDGPLIEKIENANSFGKVGWRITITDQANGFSNGYIKAIGSVDSSSFKFNFTLANVTSPGGTKFIGQYDIIINVAENCVAQDYVIEYIYLEDSNKRYSQYSRFDANYNAEKDPLRYLLDTSLINSLLTTSTISCTTQDPTPPELVSFTTTTPTIDIGSVNRYFNFTIVARDNDSGLMESQTPIVYLNAETNIFECESKIQTIDSTTATYSGECLLPFGFGVAPINAYISIYGLINNGGYYSGLEQYSVSPNFIVLLYSSTPILLNYEPVYYYSKSDIIIYGRLISGSTSVSILYSNNIRRTYTNIRTIGQSAIVIPKDEIDIVGPFDVTAFNSLNSSTNTLRVYPIYFENLEPAPSPSPTNPSPSPSPTQSPTPSPTPIPTNKPQKCIGTPECGGSNHGYCVENQGCVCYSPWIGNDCLSQIIIVPQPTINDTVPTIEIPIIDNHNNSNNNQTSTIFYKSLISIVSLREISIDGKPIKDKSFNFERWILDQVDSTTNQYYANITTKDKSNVINVIATLKWFENSTNIQFAGQNLTMNPSSIKYTIEINNFPFENNLSTLELVMQASFLSNSTSDSCSSKEFGDTSSGDNSNYLKIQIENRSLYGRFIKRCIIDDSDILSIDNKLLDEGMNTISSPNQVQTYIGISIPNFRSKVILDPDFSVIINPSSASSKSSNSVCTNKSSKLSSTKIAGIIIGCVGFACVVAAAVVYSIYKSKETKRLNKSIQVKLKNQT